MRKLRLVKDRGALWPCWSGDKEIFDKIGVGEEIEVDYRKPRNPHFHRKYFALIALGFEYWEPEPLPEEAFKLKGQVPEKDQEEFRKNIQILAGYGYPVVDVRGCVHWRSKSISFASMDNLEFEELYRNVFNVLWDKVLRHTFESEQEAEAAAEEMMRFG